MHTVVIAGKAVELFWRQNVMQLAVFSFLLRVLLSGADAAVMNMGLLLDRGCGRDQR